ncbi:ATP-binding protein [Actinomadura rubrisoli]|uniref:ATP-binding protein n=1 Tax=Actinomadura rubrisoli TaxID=2530368 RepID=A0A4R5AKP1_9ACTN|nr:ATP-binding protein [Actinomadura rubrisoli]TDD72136.1 ATP-binding protein [Actinomadura rubrisoli]
MTATLHGAQATQSAHVPLALRQKLASTPSVLSDVRCIVKAAAIKWNVGATTVEAAVLVADELVTNAVRHAKGEQPIILRMFVARDGLRIEVHDRSTKRPKRGKPDLTIPSQPVPDDAPDPHGWGMGIVEHLAKRHGVTKEHDGKTVWAVLRMTAAVPAEAP